MIKIHIHLLVQLPFVLFVLIKACKSAATPCSIKVLIQFRVCLFELDCRLILKVSNRLFATLITQSTIAFHERSVQLTI